MLGLDPLYLACGGRLVMFVPEDEAAEVVEILQQCEDTRGAKIIGKVTEDHPEVVTLLTEIGTETVLPQPTGELLPRIC